MMTGGTSSTSVTQASTKANGCSTSLSSNHQSTISTLVSSTISPVTSQNNASQESSTHVTASNQFTHQQQSHSAGPSSSTSTNRLPRNAPQTWTAEDTKLFFEALAEHGKDFGAIQSYIQQRCGKKSSKSELIKSREQVRHYYYRTWHKIAQHLELPQDETATLDKTTQEIYGLINYGEIWKKFGNKFNKQLARWLRELVMDGVAVCKVKGKTLRLKTPACKALKKLNNLEDQSSSAIFKPLPKEILVELRPSTYADWLHVSSLYQNPRVRCRVSPQKRLGTLITYLEQKWSLKHNELNGKKDAKDSLQERMIREEQKVKTRRRSLRILPAKKLDFSDLTTLSINRRPTGAASNAQIDLSLNAYLKKFSNSLIDQKRRKRKHSSSALQSTCSNNKSSGQNTKVTKLLKSEEAHLTNPEKIANINDASPAHSVGAMNLDECSQNSKLPFVEAERGLNLLNDMLASLEDRRSSLPEDQNEIKEAGDNVNDYSDGDGEVEQCEEMPIEDGEKEDYDSALNSSFDLPFPPPNSTLAQWLSGASETVEEERKLEEDSDYEDQEEKGEEQEEKGEEDIHESDRKREPKSNNQAANNNYQPLDLQRFLSGWTMSDAKMLTFGELFLIFKRPEKIMLEYKWEWVKDLSKESPEGNVESPLFEINSDENGNECTTNHANTVLSKLLTAATISLASEKAPPSNTLRVLKASNRKSRKLKKTVDLSNAPLNYSPPTSPLSRYIDSSGGSSPNLDSIVPPRSRNSPNAAQNATLMSPIPENPRKENHSSTTSFCDAQTIHQLQGNRSPFLVPISPAPKRVPSSQAGNSSTSTTSQPQGSKNKNHRKVGQEEIAEAVKKLQSQRFPVTRRGKRSVTRPALAVPPKTILPVPSNSLYFINSNSKQGASLPVQIALSSSSITMNTALGIPAPVLAKVKGAADSNPIKALIITSSPTSVTSTSSDAACSTASHFSFTTTNSITGTATTTEQTLSGQDSIVPASSSSSGVVAGFDMSSAAISNSSVPIPSVTSLSDNIVKDLHDQSNSMESGKSIENKTLVTDLPISSLLSEISPSADISLPGSSSRVTENHNLNNGSDDNTESVYSSLCRLNDISGIDMDQSNPLMSSYIASSSLNTPEKNPSLASVSANNNLILGPELCWNNGEGMDISLGTLLNSCESPMKAVPASAHNLDVNGLISDNSIDLMAKFQDLAATQMTHCETSITKAT